MTDKEMFDKNTDLLTAFMQYTLSHPEILDGLPDDFQLVILPDDDPELARRNRELLESKIRQAACRRAREIARTSQATRLYAKGKGAGARVIATIIPA